MSNFPFTAEFYMAELPECSSNKVLCVALKEKKKKLTITTKLVK